MAKKLFIKTYGCQMNVYDSARMVDVLAAEGYAVTEEQDEADLVVLNTCHIREKAAEKVYSDLGRLRDRRDEARARGRDFVIGVGGCVGQAEGGEMVRRAPAVDFVFGPQTYHRLPDMLARVQAGEKVVETDLATEPKFEALGATPSRAQIAAFLSVQEGCDKFCSFCVVPYTRGVEFSRAAGDVMDEARALVDAGTREITLLGQNVNAYHGAAPDGAGSWSLGRLVRALAEIDGLARIRFTTSHPRDMDEDLIAAHRDVPKLMPYLHLPVQSGADRILAAMNRKYTTEDFLAIVDRLRHARPDIALTSDFIVGFPGETDAEFESTLALVREVKFAAAFSFKFSPRPGTPAAALDGQVAEDIKAERLARLQDLLAGQTRAFNASCVGHVQDILFDKPGRRPGQIGGRSPYLQAVHVDGPAALIGTLQPVRITALGANSLVGALADAGVKAASLNAKVTA